MKQFYFISGLPRSGSTLITNVLSQNPEIYSEPVSSLSGLIATINGNWNQFEQNQEYDNMAAKRGVLETLFQGYYKHRQENIIIDKDRGWVALIPIVEEILQQSVKIVLCVRNPAEILSSFEKLRKINPLFVTRVDLQLRENSSIASRCMYYSGPEGPLGRAHRDIQDAITMGYLDRFLFVDYSRYCSSPRSQTKRIYDFLGLTNFDHDFENIPQRHNYNDNAVGLPNLHKVKPTLEKTTVNCVEYLGLDLYEQYNRQIFWNAWI